MDIEQATFFFQLLNVLRAISNASFVSIDLEMSGISTRLGSGARDRSRDLKKLSLQERYTETAQAAEKFQILQLGITCVEEDRERGIYVARPYNINVSPLFLEGDRLNIDRNFTFSSSAVGFLMNNSFDMGLPFTKGVVYLSREEELTSRSNCAERQESNNTMPSLVIAPSDAEALQFYRNTRQTITNWIAENKQERLDFVNIGTPAGLNGFQRRLVHQLVRDEFPEYRSFGCNRGRFMQIEKINPRKEAHIAKQKQQAHESTIARQTGLRWVFEALVNGNLQGIDAKWFAVNDKGDPAFIDLECKIKEMEQLQEELKEKEHILVGHNLFTDLVFLYRTFVGQLPQKVEEFQQQVHKLFPKVIDTKYLASHKGGSMHANTPLKDIFHDLRTQTTPFMVTVENHTKYSEAGTNHEAGWDSWMTAQIFAKLTTTLQAERNEELDTDSGDDREDIVTYEGSAPDPGSTYPKRSPFIENRFGDLMDEGDDHKGPDSTLDSNDGGGFTPYGSSNIPNPGTQGRVVIDHFSCRSLTIGSWRRKAQSTMDMIIFYAPIKACITYYFNNESNGYKIEYPFAYIKNIYVENEDVESGKTGGLVVELSRPPNFFMDSPGSWGQCIDFTEDKQASRVMVHHLGGHPKVLSGQLAKLVSLEAFQNRHILHEHAKYSSSAPVPQPGVSTAKFIRPAKKKFDAIQDMSSSTTSLLDTPIEDGFQILHGKRASVSSQASSPDVPSEKLQSKEKEMATNKLSPKQWIPSIDSGFWDIYGNRLRVNGTITGVCELGVDESDDE